MTHHSLILLCRALLLAAACSLPGITGSAWAAELKQSIEVDGDVIRLGDLLTDVGASANIAVAVAPAPGATGYVTVGSIDAAVREAGLTWQRPARLGRIAVARVGNRVSKDELAKLIADELRGRSVSGGFRVQLYSQSQKIYLATDRSVADIRVEDFELDPRSERFVAHLVIPIAAAGAAGTRSVEMQGRIERIARIPVLAHDVPRGDIIRDDDIQWLTVPLRQAGSNILRSSRDVVGMTPRRNLRPGSPLRSSDVERFALVEKGARISLSFRAGNLVIAGQGRALERGGDGEIIRVLNTASNTTVEALITGPNQVEVIATGTVSLAAR